MQNTTHGLTDPEGPPYTREEVRRLLHLRDDGTLRSWAKRGSGPPFVRIGAKHSRVLYPRAQFWRWVDEHTFESEEEAAAAEARS